MRKHKDCSKMTRSNGGREEGAIYKTSDPTGICSLTSTTPQPLERDNPSNLTPGCQNICKLLLSDKHKTTTMQWGRPQTALVGSI